MTERRKRRTDPEFWKRRAESEERLRRIYERLKREEAEEAARKQAAESGEQR